MGRNMFRLSFERAKLENVEEHPSVFIPVCVDMFLHVQPIFMRMQTCSYTRLSVLQFMLTQVPSCICV